jgi:hypothetical protein
MNLNGSCVGSIRPVKLIIEDCVIGRQLFHMLKEDMTKAVRSFVAVILVAR